MTTTKEQPKGRGRCVSELGGDLPTRASSETKDRIKSAISGDDFALKPKISTNAPQNNNQKSLTNSRSNNNVAIRENPNSMTMPSSRSVIMDLFGASIGRDGEKYQKQLREKEEELFQLTIEKRKADQEVALYKERLEKGSIDTKEISSYVHFKNQVELEQHRVQKLQQELEEKNLMIEKLEKSSGIELEEMKTRINRQEEMIIALNKEKEELQVFKDNYKLEIEAVSKQIKEQAQKEIEALKNEINNEKKAQNKLKEELDSLTEEHLKVLQESLKDPESMMELEALKEENEKLRESEAYIATLLDTIEKHKHDKSTWIAQSKELEKIKFEHKLLVQRYEDLKKEKDQDKQAKNNERVQFLEKESEKKNLENEELTKQAANANNRVKALENQVREISKNNEDKSSIEKEFVSYKQEMNQKIANLTAQLEEAQRNEADAHSKIEDLEVELETERTFQPQNRDELVADLKEEIEKLREETNTLQEQIMNLVAENEKLENELYNTKNEANRANKKYEMTLEQLKNANVEKEKLNQIIESNKNFKEKEEQITKLMQDLSTMEQATTALKSKLAKKKEKITILNGKISQTEKTKYLLGETNDELSDEIFKLTSKLQEIEENEQTNANKVHAMLQLDIKNLEKKLEEKEQEITNLKTDLSLMCTHNNDISLKIVDLTQQVHAMSADMHESKQREMNELDEVTANLQSTLDLIEASNSKLTAEIEEMKESRQKTETIAVQKLRNMFVQVQKKPENGVFWQKIVSKASLK